MKIYVLALDKIKSFLCRILKSEQRNIAIISIVGYDLKVGEKDVTVACDFLLWNQWRYRPKPARRCRKFWRKK